jgi:hypothetical protein
VLSESSSCIDRPHEPEQRSTSPQPSRTDYFFKRSCAIHYGKQ